MGASPKFYKYRSLSGCARRWTERVFTHREAYFATPASFNDPFDCRFRLSYDATPEAKAHSYLRYFTDHLCLPRPEAERRVEQWFRSFTPREYVAWQKHTYEYNIRERDRMGVFCLTELRDQILMWAHYADGHQGICLEFQATTQPQIGFLLPCRVDYFPQDRLPEINAYTSSPDDKLKLTCLTKSKHWKYEKEHRILDFSGYGPRTFPEGTLKGVILGASISTEDERCVLGWAHAHSTPLAIYRARPKEEEYGLEIIGLEEC